MNFSSILGEKILESTILPGGCIGNCYRVKTDSGQYFIKHYSKPGVSIREAQGLKELANSNTVSVPRVLNSDDHFLVLNFISQNPRAVDFQTRLGRDLAQLHKTSSSRYGFHEDNYIGSTPQKNSFKENWIEFYIENRLDFQVKLSADRDVLGIYKKLRKRIPEILNSSLETPCLIHGDLWSGNVISDENGLPVLIDPAAYYGHRELELAMTQLFGGFHDEFYDSYNRVFPLIAGWKERMDLYKLYHILNHLNLFGTGYKNQALTLMRRFVT